MFTVEICLFFVDIPTLNVTVSLAKFRADPTKLLRTCEGSVVT